MLVDLWVETLVVPLVERMDNVSVGLMVDMKECLKDDYLAVAMAEHSEYIGVVMLVVMKEC